MDRALTLNKKKRIKHGSVGMDRYHPTTTRTMNPIKVCCQGLNIKTHYLILIKLNRLKFTVLIKFGHITTFDVIIPSYYMVQFGRLFLVILIIRQL